MYGYTCETGRYECEPDRYESETDRYECEPDGDQALPVCGAAMRQLTKTDQANVSIEVIEGANHGYEGQQTTLFDTVHRWLVQL